MPIWLQPALTAIWLAWLAQAIVSWMLAAKLSRIVGHRPKVYDPPYEPHAHVIVPFKGLEPNLRANVRALCTQAYPAYHLVCVLESDQDPAAELVRDELASIDPSTSQATTEIVIAGQASDHQGQKVHNLLTALDHLEPVDEQSVLVFADSDAVPNQAWLGRLVGPLSRPGRTGVTTGYRWLIAAPGQGRSKASFWAHLAGILNASVASFYVRRRYCHAWGGSMALRAQTARRGDLRGRWQGAVTDDYPVTALARELGLAITFVPHCLVPSPVDYGLAGFVNFARRQYLITKVSAPKLIFASLAFQSLYLAGFISAWAALVTVMVRPIPWGLRAWPIAILGIVFLFNQLRATARRNTIKRAFGEQMVEKLRITLAIDRWLTPIWTAVHLGIVLSALFGRTIRWRGNRYRIHGPQSVERLHDEY